MKGIIFGNIKKSVGSLSFWLCVIMVFLLCFTSEVHDRQSQNPVLVIEAVFNAAAKSRIDYCAYLVFKSACGGRWLIMFIPVVSAFSFVPQFCNERKSHAARNFIIRKSKAEYNAGSFLSAFLCGACACAVGTVLFGICCMFLFKPLSAYPAGEIEMYERSFEYAAKPIAFLYGKIGNPALAAVNVAEMFIYGGIYALPAMCIASFVKNKYIVVCVPFFLKYTLTQFNSMLVGYAIRDLDNIRYDIVKYTSIFSPDGIIGIVSAKDALWRMAVNIAAVAGMSVIFYICMNRRVDCGD